MPLSPLQNPTRESPSEIAELLKVHANELLFQRGIDTILRKYGEVFYCGSYALDLMAWPDIDLFIRLKEGSLLDMVPEFRSASEIKCMKDLHLKNSLMPKGEYLQLKFDAPSWKAKFKVDIWSYSEEEQERNLAQMEEIRSKLTPAKKELILAVKQAIMTEAGRTPSLSGVKIYDAVLNQELKTVEEVLSSPAFLE